MGRHNNRPSRSRPAKARDRGESELKKGATSPRFEPPAQKLTTPRLRYARQWSGCVKLRRLPQKAGFFQEARLPSGNASRFSKRKGRVAQLAEQLTLNQ